MHKKTLNDIQFARKIILMRVDFNVPILNGSILDISRIQATLPSIKKLLEKNATIILISHLGRPNTNNPQPKLSLKIVADALQKELKKPITFLHNCNKENIENTIKNNPKGSVFLLENIRFYPEETQINHPNRKKFVANLAKIADLFVNDAFATAHRNHASSTDIPNLLPSAMGLLFEKEIHFLNSLLHNPKTPFFTILGGSKISSKLPLIKNLLPKIDKILIGGAMTFSFLKAMQLEIGNSLIEPKLINSCKNLLHQAEKKIELPQDIKVGNFNFHSMTCKTPLQEVSVRHIPPALQGLDIGQKTINHYKSILSQAKTILWNGPMGVFECEKTAIGTIKIAKILAQFTKNGATTIIGGGESAAAVKKAGLSNQMTHVSTGGGATLEFLQGSPLPGLTALADK